jgi:hypothetical protein
MRAAFWAIPSPESWSDKFNSGLCFICDKRFKRVEEAQFTTHLQEHGAQIWEQMLLPEEKNAINQAALGHDAALRYNHLFFP